MKKKPNFTKKGLTLQHEEDDPLAHSIYSQMYFFYFLLILKYVKIKDPI